MKLRVMLVLVLITIVMLVGYATAIAQGGRARYWIECDPDGNARINVYTDPYPWPYPPNNGGEVRVYSNISPANGEGPMNTNDIQPKYVNPHGNRGVNSVDYRITLRYGDGYQETIYLYYRWPSGCNPTSPVVPQPPTNPPPPTIDYAATEAARQATQRAIDSQNATAQAQAAEVARRATVQAIQIQNADATRRAIEAEAAAAASRATDQAIRATEQAIRDATAAAYAREATERANANATAAANVVATSNAIGTLTTSGNETATALAKAKFQSETTATAQANALVALNAQNTITAIAMQGANAAASATAQAAANATNAANGTATTVAMAGSSNSSGTSGGQGSSSSNSGNTGGDNTSTMLIGIGVFVLLAIFGAMLFVLVRRRAPAPAASVTTQTMTAPVNAQVVGNYDIIRPIGSGGQGSLYLARHRALRKLVALKKSDAGGDPAQFQREASMLANLTHSSMPRVTDFFVEPNGTQVLVMDYIEGQNLEEIVEQRGAMSESAALTSLRPIIQAVKYLHHNRIIHRDIKPANIIITPDGNSMLVDFGIAKTLATGQLTRTGAWHMGTAGYAPPEQYSGGTTERSDIYALGATLYFILTGHVPIESTNRAAGAILTPPRQLNANISPRTETAILTTMNLAASQRYATVNLLEQAMY